MVVARTGKESVLLARVGVVGSYDKRLNTPCHGANRAEKPDAWTPRKWRLLPKTPAYNMVTISHGMANVEMRCIRKYFFSALIRDLYLS